MSDRGEGRRGRVVLLGLGVIVVGAAAAALWAGAARGQGQDTGGTGGTLFSSYIDDLPIMPGLAEADHGYALDLHQGGRIAEARLGGDADPTVVRGFYAATLGQMGWKPAGDEPYVYTRAGEKLTFTVEPRKGRRGLEAVFVVTPHAPGVAATR